MINPEGRPTENGSGVTDAETFAVTLTLDEGYAFDVDPGLPGARTFRVDETPPLGSGSGPNPSRVLATAIASCLGSSLLFCLRKARVNVESLTVKASGNLVRNDRKRLRIGAISVELFPRVAPGDEGRMARCLEVFEDFCLVTESVRHGIPVTVGIQTASA